MSEMRRVTGEGKQLKLVCVGLCRDGAVLWVRWNTTGRISKGWLVFQQHYLRYYLSIKLEEEVCAGCKG